MNNLTVATVTSDQYSSAFGFLEEEVYDGLAEMAMDNRANRGEVRKLYDGFAFKGKKVLVAGE